MTRVLTGAGLACTRDWVSSLRLSGKRWGHKGRYTLGDKLQWQIIPCVQVRRLVAATCYGDTSEQQLALCVLEKFLWKSLSLQQNYVAATSHTNSVWFDFLQHVAATKFCCRAKIFTKILQYTWSDLLLRRAVATCCCNLSPSVYRP